MQTILIGLWATMWGDVPKWLYIAVLALLICLSSGCAASQATMEKSLADCQPVCAEWQGE